jgi:hypothetical protein
MYIGNRGYKPTHLTKISSSKFLYGGSAKNEVNECKIDEDDASERERFRNEMMGDGYRQRSRQWFPLRLVLSVLLSDYI